MEILNEFRIKSLSRKERRFLSYKDIPSNIIPQLWMIASGAKTLLSDNSPTKCVDAACSQASNSGVELDYEEPDEQHSESYYKRLLEDFPPYPNP
jgi:hypothetical protein